MSRCRYSSIDKDNLFKVATLDLQVNLLAKVICLFILLSISIYLSLFISLSLCL